MRLLAFACAACSSALLGSCAALSGAHQSVADTKGSMDTGADTTKSTMGQVKDATGDAKKKKKGEADAPAADDDGDRLHAKESPINTPLDDQVSAKTGDKFDWRKFQLAGKPGIATFELHWDDESSDLSIDVYDAYGSLVAPSPRKIEGKQVKKTLVQIEPGLYYVRVGAVGAKDASIYTLAVKWKGPASAAPVAAAPPAPTAATPGAAATPAAAPAGAAGAPAAPDANKVHGAILQSYRGEDGQMVLYLDQGGSAGLKVGMNGTVLDGADGDKPLDGGRFTISTIVDDKKAIARSSVSKLGKNKRFVVNLK